MSNHLTFTTNDSYDDAVQITSIPASDELVAERFPVLPQNHPDAPHHLPRESIERLLDVHFRQLRHEALFPLVQAARTLVSRSSEVQVLVRRRGSSKLDLHRQLGCEEQDSVPIFAFDGAAYVGADIDPAVGVVHRFQAHEIQEIQVSCEDNCKIVVCTFGYS